VSSEFSTAQSIVPGITSGRSSMMPMSVFTEGRNGAEAMTTRVLRRPPHLPPLAIISVGILASFASATFLAWLLFSLLTM
jgi:hypothetical protein